MKKFTLTAAAAAALGFAATSAFAVDIDALPIVPTVHAKEIVATVAAPVVLLNPANSLDIATALGYSFSAGEIRYVRLELANGVFTTGTVGVGGGGAAGVVNGLGTSVIYFSITAPNPIAGFTGTSTITIDGTRTITGTASNMTVSYSLYDQPSQAQAGGSAGRIIDKANRAYVNFANSQTLAITTDSATATVALAPAFSTFVATGNHTASTARLAALDYRLVTPVPLIAAGTAITLANMNAVGASGTKLVVSGDFSAAANVDATYTGAALARVYLATTTACTTPGGAVNASLLSATTATFNVGATATTANMHLCYTPRNPTAIPASSYTAALNAVAAGAVYTATSVSAAASGAIVRDGTVLQIPLAQTTSGYISRFVLTNTSSSAAAYSTSFLTEAGVSVAAGSQATGTIPANGSVVINAADLMTITGAPRATVIFTVAQNTNSIQGQYQIVNATTGSVSNTVMVRAGTN